MEKINKKTYSKIIAIISLLGVLFGISICCKIEFYSISFLLYTLLMFLALISAYLLYFDKSFGKELSSINYFSQIVGFNTKSGFNFDFDLGFYLKLKIALQDLIVSIEFGLETVFFLNENIDSVYISINFFAISVIYHLNSSKENFNSGPFELNTNPD